MSCTLVILAAGKGSRYGGMKQLDHLGPSGETIMDYSVYDAIRAGFSKVVFVIRKSFEKEFRAAVSDRWKDRIEVQLAFQEMDALPAGFNYSESREKPWGTAHAIWVSHSCVSEPFAVINADDFYGAEAFAAMGEFLNQTPDATTASPQLPEYAMVAYRIGNTLSEHGRVSRGICRLGDSGFLEAVQEHTAIGRGPDGIITSSENQAEAPQGMHQLSEESLVSMNFWGFTPDIFAQIELGFLDFLHGHAHDNKAEFYIPMLVDDLISRSKARVKVLFSEARWFGVTYRQDRDEAVRTLADLVSRGRYPANIFTGQ